MRKISFGIAMAVLVLLNLKGYTQEKRMTWTTTSAEARELAQQGAEHFMNIEFEQAYFDFTSALKLDPDFTIPLVFMSNLTRGKTRDAFAARALKSAANKTDGEKLFASMADSSMTREQNMGTWKKLHDMFPDGEILQHFYVVTRQTPDEQFAAGQEYMKKFPGDGSVNNLLGYYYMTEKKDNAMAKQYFEKYIAAYPEGANPYDSMGEFYLITGDLANAKKYYQLSLEKFPFNNSSINALQKMEDNAKSKTTK